MQWYEAIILGLVEGITEYLPVSSTGHLIIASALLGLDEPLETKRAVDAFNIVIQGGAILAVLGLYRNRVAQMIRGLLGKDAPGLRLAINIIIAFLPAVVFGLLLDDYIESKLFYPRPVIAALALGGIVMIVLKPRRKTTIDLELLTWKFALIIGLAQCLAMWPGMSRSMVTIVAGMLIGLRPKHAAEFSFLLGLPTLGGACFYKGLKNFMGDGPNMIETLGFTPLIIGIVVATIAAALAIKWLVSYLNAHGLAVFGWYRLILCAVLGMLIWKGQLTIAPPPDSPNRDAPELTQFPPSHQPADSPDSSPSFASAFVAPTRVAVNSRLK